jgi:DnaK suppressor protein
LYLQRFRLPGLRSIQSRPGKTPEGLPSVLGCSGSRGLPVLRGEQEVKAETSKSKAVTKASAPAAKAAADPAPAKATKVAASSKVAAAQPAADPAPADPQLPSRTTRPSSRLAQLTVPSMAQAVASTAAKASYQHTMPTTAPVQTTFTAAKKDPKLANNWKTKEAQELTDAEVLAMPDSEYMNDKQMAFFRLKLVQLKQDIHNSAGETTEHLREDTVVVPDPADRATIEEEHALELRTRDRERKLLKKIEQSIARIDAGDYGYCDETGEPIGVGRLIARPTATLSLEAQQRRELKQKMFGD